METRRTDSPRRLAEHPVYALRKEALRNSERMVD